jgi:hypothetical protein
LDLKTSLLASKNSYVMPPMQRNTRVEKGCAGCANKLAFQAATFGFDELTKGSAGSRVVSRAGNGGAGKDDPKKKKRPVTSSVKFDRLGIGFKFDRLGSGSKSDHLVIGSKYDRLGIGSKLSQPPKIQKLSLMSIWDV